MPHKPATPCPKPSARIHRHSLPLPSASITRPINDFPLTHATRARRRWVRHETAHPALFSASRVRKGKEGFKTSRVPILRLKLPVADRVAGYLRRIDEARFYTNFGPLVTVLEDRIVQHYSLNSGCDAGAHAGSDGRGGAARHALCHAGLDVRGLGTRRRRCAGWCPISSMSTHTLGRSIPRRS
jgi:hypothetical protein